MTDIRRVWRLKEALDADAFMSRLAPNGRGRALLVSEFYALADFYGVPREGLLGVLLGAMR
jgi:hypothetical protein